MLIVGSRGVLGELTAEAFWEAGWTVRCGARRPHHGEVHVDLDSPESVTAALREHQLVVNTVPHHALTAERIVLDGGGTLINTSALPAAAARSLRAGAGAARGTVLMNAGLAPGVTNLVAADLLRAHPGAEEVEIAFTLSSSRPRGGASADFMHRGLTAVARHRTAIVPLPEPFGPRECLAFAEPEAAWIGGIAEGRVVRLYLCLADTAAHERMLELNRRAAMNRLQRGMFNAPSRGNGDGDGDEPVAHWIAVKTGERRLSAATVRCQGDFVHAARSTVIFAEALTKHWTGRGCFDPEEICSLGQLEPRLQAAGVRVIAQPVYA